ncbi:MAG: RhuM family protein [Advenella sp.]
MGKRQVTRRIKHCKLDAIISVGCRVNSGRATHVRQWATRVLHESLTQDYNLNEHRLAQEGLTVLTLLSTLASRVKDSRQLTQR